ncbi:MAG: dihydroneopterin aldolase [candidate division NC10 bacterium]|nr:dihydroneopterin aldolase [candidate division NC10 bacterium]
MDRIVLQGIRFYGHHGATEAEQTLGQRFQVDVELGLDLRPAGGSDDLQATVNYALVHRLVVEVGTQERFHLLEALAERIAQVILERFPVKEVKVRACKPSPPLQGELGFVGVEIVRS